MGKHGQINVSEQSGKHFVASLFDFDIDKSDLKPAHQIWLTASVVPILREGGSIIVVGMTSRSDTIGHNQALSERRAKSVIDFLESVLSTSIVSKLETAVGEIPAMLSGVADGVEDERWRAVTIRVWKEPDSPPRPKPVPPVILESRKKLATFVTKLQINDRGATRMDGAGARYADLAMRIRRDVSGIPVHFEYKQVPKHYKLVHIAIHKDDSGSVEYGISGVEMETCYVDYTWAERKRQIRPLLFDNFTSNYGSLHNNPQAYSLSIYEAERWLEKPAEALESILGWDRPAEVLKNKYKYQPLSMDEYRKLN